MLAEIAVIVYGAGMVASFVAIVLLLNNAKKELKKKP